ncbi:MAG TPA: EAL domain-containing protein [Euzebyales bacterium]|nr:EAL domain-containing protein [Euzebyales bacterium]
MTLVVGVVTLAVSAIALHAGRRRTRRTVAALLFAVGIWNLAYAIEIATTSMAVAEIVGGVIKYAAVAAVPPVLLIFVLQFTRRANWITRPLTLLLAIEPLWVVTMLALPGTRTLIRFYEHPLDPPTVPLVDAGPLFWVHYGYIQILLVIGSVLLISALARLPRSAAPQARLMLAAVALPWLVNIAVIFRIGPFGRFDATSIAFAVFAKLLLWGSERFALFDVVPVARDLVIEQMSDAVLVLDEERTVIDLNPAAEQLIERQRSHAFGLSAGELMRAVPEVRALLDDVGTRPARTELVLPTRDRGALHFDAVASHLPSYGTAARGYLLVLRDVTDRKRLDAELQRLAHFDTLTGLPNRKLFSDRLSQALARARRDGTPLAVLFCDLDGFKRINDTLGHAHGDDLLREVATRLQRRIRDGDTVARFGGDEYTIILSQLTRAGDAALVARKLLAELNSPIELGGMSMQITASIGIAIWPRDGDDQEALVRCADMAMYRAKALGPNELAFFTSEIGKTVATRHRLEDDLRAAVSNHQLELAYQPQLAVSSEGIAGDVLGVEALARWHHPELGVIPPSTFIPLAEELGLMNELGGWVLRRSCQQAAAWRERLHRIVPIGVNISGRQLNPELLSHLDDALGRARLDPTSLVIELSEPTVTSHGEHATELIGAIRARGVRVALDDYGTGVTSTMRLANLPLDVIKIDRSLVAGLVRDTDQRASAVLDATINLAHDLGLLVIGEGVEQPVQQQRLGVLGCDALQGNLIARPQSAVEIQDMLGSRVPR